MSKHSDEELLLGCESYRAAERLYDWQEKKDYEGAYMAWQEGVSRLKRLYQNISQPELKDSYLQKSPHRELLTKFKEIATFLARTV